MGRHFPKSRSDEVLELVENGFLQWLEESNEEYKQPAYEAPIDEHASWIRWVIAEFHPVATERSEIFIKWISKNLPEATLATAIGYDEETMENKFPRLVEVFVSALIAKTSRCSLSINGGHIIMMSAAAQGYLSLVKHLVASGVDCQIEDNSPFFYAIREGHLEIAKYFVDYGGVPLLCRNKHGSNALHIAARVGRVYVTKYFALERPEGVIDVTLRDKDGLTPIVLAIGCGHGLVMKLLWEASGFEKKVIVTGKWKQALTRQSITSIDIFSFLLRVFTEEELQDLDLYSSTAHLASVNDNETLFNLVIRHYPVIGTGVPDVSYRTPLVRLIMDLFSESNIKYAKKLLQKAIFDYHYDSYQSEDFRRWFVYSAVNGGLSMVKLLFDECELTKGPLDAIGPLVLDNIVYGANLDILKYFFDERESGTVNVEIVRHMIVNAPFANPEIEKYVRAVKRRANN